MSRLVTVADVRQLGASFHAAALLSLEPAEGEPWSPWPAELPLAELRETSTVSKASVAGALLVDRSNYARWSSGGPVSVEQVREWMLRWASIARPLVLLVGPDGTAVVAPRWRLAEALSAVGLGAP